MPLLRLVALFVAFAACAWSQSVHWEPQGGSLALNRSSEIQLVFENCEPEEEPAVPSVSGLELQRAGQMESTNMVNGTVTRSMVFSYNARPTATDRLVIPNFTVRTDKGNVTVQSVAFDVGKAAAGNGKIPLDSVAQARFQLADEVWAGEVFDLNYRIAIVRRYFAQFASNLNWTPAPLITEDWSKPTLQEMLLNGDKQVVLTMNTRAIAPTPGVVELTAGNQLVNIVTGASSFGFLSSPNLEQFAITTDRPRIEVKPLPPAAPTSFNGAVGQFKLTSKVVPAAAQVGEPVTWTLTLEGTGNWPSINALPSRDVAKSFRVVQSQPKRTPKAGQLFDGTLAEDVVLIPTVPGEYTLGPVTWTYFDPQSGQYKTVLTDAQKISISPAAPLAPTPASGAAPLDLKTPAAPAFPSPVPGDAVNGANVAGPIAPRVFALLCAVIAFGVLGAWFGLAAYRASRQDPARPRREARRRLATAIDAVAASSDVESRTAAIQTWQREAITVWGLDHASPSASAFSSAPAWERLWSEAEAFLYRGSTPLPNDWPERARSAAAELRIPSFKISSAFKPQHLFPILIFAACIVSQRSDARPIDDYQKGNLAAAEAGWRTDLEKEPTNWALHHNLSLALAQQALWAEAAAHASLSFIQAPSQPDAVRQLRLCLAQAGYAPQGIPELLEDTPSASLARSYSPAGWQRLMLLAALLLGTFVTVRLLLAYRPRHRIFHWLANTAILLALATIALGAYGKRAWGLFGDSRAVLVWQDSTLRSIPTAADTKQQTSALPAGSVAVADVTFLGWTRLRFANDQTGWVRTSEVMPVWRANEVKP